MQDKLLQSSQEAQKALKPLQDLPDALTKLQERQDAAPGIVLEVVDSPNIVTALHLRHKERKSQTESCVPAQPRMSQSSLVSPALA